jgi:hypothetical protein
MLFTSEIGSLFFCVKLQSNLWPLLTGGRCSEVGLCFFKDLNWDFKIEVVLSKWSLLGVGC